MTNFRELYHKSKNPNCCSQFLSLSSSEVAKALTLQESHYFSCIQIKEFLERMEWNKLQKKEKKKKENAIDERKGQKIENKNNILENESKSSEKQFSEESNPLLIIIRRFNEVSAWVTTEVVSNLGKKQQRTVEKFIEVAVKCCKLGNFNSLMEILSGLNNSAVQRLQLLWNTISEKHRRYFQRLEDIMNTYKNFYRYRQELTKRRLPLLPYCGLYLRDLLFLKENQSFLSDGNINFELLTLIGKRLDEIKRFQSVSFELDNTGNEHTEKALYFLNNLVIIQDEEILYQLSVKSDESLQRQQHSEGYAEPSFNEFSSSIGEGDEEDFFGSSNDFSGHYYALCNDSNLKTTQNRLGFSTCESGTKTTTSEDMLSREHSQVSSSTSSSPHGFSSSLPTDSNFTPEASSNDSYSTGDEKPQISIAKSFETMTITTPIPEITTTTTTTTTTTEG